MNEAFLSKELTTWLKAFEQKKQRKLRVLHIGNIAANGFLNAKFMRRVGIEADVLCYDYYHIMGYPEWEEIAIEDNYHQDIQPRFSERDLGNYQRPRWFVQGPLSLCFAYLHARHHGEEKDAEQLWQCMNAFLFDKKAMPHVIFKSGVKVNWLWYVVLGKEKIKLVLLPSYQYLKKWPLIGKILQSVRAILHKKPKQALLNFIDQLNSQYQEAFPDRQFKFTIQELQQYFTHQQHWENLFSYYDVIQCYATDPIYGLLYGKQNYIAFEHGTLRTFTSDDSTINALTALAYRKAYHAFITNGDCLAYAQGLNMTNFSPMIHPVDIEQHRIRNEDRIQQLRTQYQADVLLFCPLRHDWEIKGTDKHIRALPYLNQMLSKRIILVMANWGADLEKSKTLAKSLGVEEQIVWSAPLSRVKMIEMLQICDVLLDQTILPCFGSTTPQALACGTPALMSYKAETTTWLIPEPAPIIQASNEQEIAAGVKQALDPTWLAAFKQRAAHWINTYHSSQVALETQLRVYQQLLN